MVLGLKLLCRHLMSSLMRMVSFARKVNEADMFTVLFVTLYMFLCYVLVT